MATLEGCRAAVKPNKQSTAAEMWVFMSMKKNMKTRAERTPWIPHYSDGDLSLAWQ